MPFSDAIFFSFWKLLLKCSQLNVSDIFFSLNMVMAETVIHAIFVEH